MRWVALQAWLEPQGLESAGLEPLAWKALDFTPRVARATDAVLMEVSASLRLFGGMRGLLIELQGRSREVLWPAGLRAAPGETALVALGRLRLAQPWRESARVGPGQLPLQVLDAAVPHLDVLSRLGCRCWDDVRKLPRDGLARRFGQPLLDALDVAFGQRPESHVWLQLPEVFEQRIELPAMVEHSAGLLFALQRLLLQLKVWLEARSHAVLALRLLWQLDVRRASEPSGELVLRLSQATQDVSHIARLAAERLARVQLPAPARSLVLQSLETVVFQAESRSLLPQEQRQGASLEQMVERLGARLGHDAVQHWQGLACHVPERMQLWDKAVVRAALTPTLSKRASGKLEGPARPDRGPFDLLPTWLLSEPLRLKVCNERPCYEGPLVLLVGPQRLETSGWHGLLPGQGTQMRASQPPVMRDYFIAHSKLAGLLWIFRERLARQQAGGWFLHGLFA